jgi:hypothetical protein
MINQLLRTIDQIGVCLICFCIPGIALTLNGIYVIRTKRTISVGTDFHFRWKKPVLIIGQQAVRDESCGLIFGIGLFLVGLIIIIGMLQ